MVLQRYSIILLLLFVVIPMRAMQKESAKRSISAVRKTWHIFGRTAFNEWPPMHKIVMRGDSYQFLKMLETVLVDFKDHHGVTALHVAAIMNDQEIMGILLEHGAEVNVRDCLGRTPLHYAAMFNPMIDIDNGYYGNDLFDSPDTIKFLLEQGAHIEALDANGMTPLQWASRMQSDTLRTFIQHGAEMRGALNQSRLKFILTPLQKMAALGQLMDIKKLRMHSAISPNKLTNALAFAVGQRQLETVKYLLECQALPFEAYMLLMSIIKHQRLNREKQELYYDLEKILSAECTLLIRRLLTMGTVGRGLTTLQLHERIQETYGDYAVEFYEQNQMELRFDEIVMLESHQNDHVPNINRLFSTFALFSSKL